MDPRPLKVGEIVQINPAHDGGRGKAWFGGTLLTVTESKSWGCQGYVQSAGVEGQHFYRCKWQDMEPTGGMAPWVLGGSAGYDQDPDT